MATPSASDSAVKAILDAIGGSASSATSAIENVGNAIEGINKSVLTGGNSMKALSESMELVGKAGEAAAKSISLLVEKAPILGNFSKIFGVLGGVFKNVGQVAGAFVGAIGEAAGVMDGMTGITRETVKQLYEVSAGFGGGLKAAWDYKNMILSLAETLSTYEFGFIRQAEVQAMFAAAKAARLSLDDLTQTITTSDGSMTAYAAGILQASALNLEMAEYTKLLGDAIYGQGLSTQQAMEQLSSFRDVSGDTGVALDDVTSTLQGMSRSFRSLGVQASFGEPVLRGYAKSLQEIGLGAENAKKLTEDLSKSLIGITQDPALAYLTSQFGDLSYGVGGGAVSATIDMQAALLKEGGQGQVGAELVGAMKDTVAALGGGRIVTVTEGSENKALAETSYKQMLILQDLFKIDSKSSARTLEMLAQLEDATKAGDADMVAKLTKDIQDGVSVRNTTLSFQDAMSAKVDAAVAQLHAQTSSLQFLAMHAGKAEIDIVGESILKKAGEVLDFSGLNKEMSDSLSALGITEGTMVSTGQLEGLINSIPAFGNINEALLGKTDLPDATEAGAGKKAAVDPSALIPSFSELAAGLGEIVRAVEGLKPLLKSVTGMAGTVGSGP